MKVDQTIALSHSRHETDPGLTIGQRMGYLFGVAMPALPVWYLGTLIGAAIGRRIPDAFALEFAVPITFIAVVAPMLKSLAHVSGAVTSVTLAIAPAWVPSTWA